MRKTSKHNSGPDIHWVVGEEEGGEEGEEEEEEVVWQWNPGSRSCTAAGRMAENWAEIQEAQKLTDLRERHF